MKAIVISINDSEVVDVRLNSGRIYSLDLWRVKPRPSFRVGEKLEVHKKTNSPYVYLSENKL